VRRAGRWALTALFAALLAACGKSPGEPAPPPSPALWEVTGQAGERGWLFGTIHAMPDDIEWRTPELESALAGADLLLVEIADLDDAAALRATFNRLAMTPGQPPLSQRVPAAARAPLAGLIRKAGMREGDFAAMETWASAMLLARVSAEEDDANGVDKALIREFRGPVQELEGAARQLGIFDALPEQDQRDLLAAVVEEEPGSEAESRRMVRAWASGDMAAIERETRTGLLADAELRAALLTGRNLAWVHPVEQALRRGHSPLVAVGGAHMAGPEGLPALLAGRGWTVRRID